MSLYKKFKTDKTRETDGVTHDLGEGVTVTLARWGNPKHLEAERVARAPYRSFTASGRPLPDDVAERVTIKAMVPAVLRGWSGFTDESDQPLPFSVDAAIKVLTDLPDLKNMLIGMAMEAEAYRSQSVQADAGNSSAASSST